MDTALARLRAKTDRELGILVDRQLHRSVSLPGAAPTRCGEGLPERQGSAHRCRYTHRRNVRASKIRCRKFVRRSNFP